MNRQPLTADEKAKLERALAFLNLEAIVRDVVEVVDERRAIARGETAPVGYGEIATAIKTCPITYLPALLTIVVERCHYAGTFAEGGLETTVASVIRNARK